VSRRGDLLRFFIDGLHDPWLMIFGFDPEVYFVVWVSLKREWAAVPVTEEPDMTVAYCVGGLVLSYGTAPVLQVNHLEIKSGEAVALVGQMARGRPRSCIFWPLYRTR